MQALAGEVVALEEKSLHARSAELRAGKRVEEVALEARKARQLQASATAECADLRATVAAFQVHRSYRKGLPPPPFPAFLSALRGKVGQLQKFSSTECADLRTAISAGRSGGSCPPQPPSV